MRLGSTIYYPNGSVALLGSTVYYPNGAVARLGSTLYYPDGSTAYLGRSAYFKSGTVALLGDTAYYQDGSTARLGSTTYYESGSICGGPVTVREPFECGCLFIRATPEGDTSVVLAIWLGSTASLMVDARSGHVEVIR